MTAIPSCRGIAFDAAFDVVILGAGIVGWACALEFSEGGVQVAIVESQ